MTSLEKQKDMYTEQCLQSNEPKIRQEKKKRGKISAPRQEIQTHL